MGLIFDVKDIKIKDIKILETDYKTQIELIKHQFNRVIQHSQCIENPKIDDLFRLWQISKQPYFKAFGNKFIYEVPEKVSFELDADSKRKKVNDFVYELKDKWLLEELGNFVFEQSKGFFDNLVVDDYTTNNGTKIRKGTKLLKSFKYFINDKRLEAIQNEASRIIQENKIEGKLCFSIHPLDYLSISETTHCWRSCHSLDGEYRAGNLSYMVDESTIVCYLKSDNDTVLPHFPEDVPWNSKKWRVLLYNSNDFTMLFAGRQYPFSTKTGLDTVLNYYKKIIPKPITDLFWDPPKVLTWTPWTDYMLVGNLHEFTEHIGFPIHLDSRHVPCGNGIKKLNSLVKDDKESCQFNDVLCSSCYEPQYTILYYPEDEWNFAFLVSNSSTKFHIGGPTYCLECGKNIIPRGEGQMVCEDCKNEDGKCWYCECCGECLYEDEIWTPEDSDGIFCRSCFEDMFR